MFEKSGERMYAFLLMKGELLIRIEICQLWLLFPPRNHVANLLHSSGQVLHWRSIAEPYIVKTLAGLNIADTRREKVDLPSLRF